MSKYLEYDNDLWMNVYKLSTNYIRSSEINNLINEYSKKTSLIVEYKKSGKDIEDIKQDLMEISSIISEKQKYNLSKRNILKQSSIDDERIWFWKDSIVYQLKNNSSYVYKEWKEWLPNSLKYLKNKYLILKKYLWDLIPKSYFVYWEWYSSIPQKRFLKNWGYIWEKIITIQKKIKWKDISKMTNEEKHDEIFLLKLENAHKKYILLKLFINSITKDLWFSKKTMDVQLDLWRLSNIDNFHNDDIDFIDNELKTPNIMWDWEDISFIDFWFWEWSEEKEIIFNEIMKEETFKKWKEISSFLIFP